MGTKKLDRALQLEKEELREKLRFALIGASAICILLAGIMVLRQRRHKNNAKVN